MNLDTWNTVINGQDTYTDIWQSILPGHSLLIGWTDGRGTHYDILFVLGKKAVGHINALHPSAIKEMHRYAPVLFVSVLRLGAFGWNLGEDEALHPEYVAEKLNINALATAEALTVLLNGLKSIYMGKHYETEIGSHSSMDRALPSEGKG